MTEPMETKVLIIYFYKPDNKLGYEICDTKEKAVKRSVEMIMNANECHAGHTYPLHLRLLKMDVDIHFHLDINEWTDKKIGDVKI